MAEVAGKQEFVNHLVRGWCGHTYGWGGAPEACASEPGGSGRLPADPLVDLNPLKPHLPVPALRVEVSGQGVSPHVPKLPADGRAHGGQGC